MRALSLERILAVGLLLALGLGSLGAEEGVDKISDQEMEKLDGLRLDYDLARGEVGITEWVEPMEKLRKGYRERMQKVQDEFAQKGDLQKALTARDAGKNDPTEATLNTSVKEIAHVQKIFIEAEKQMQKRLEESLLELARSYVEKLTTIADRLTQINRLDAAIFVDELIQELVAEMGMQTVNELRRTSLIPGGSNITKLGLVAYYPFNGNARDESGNRNDGTVNGATLTTDRSGRSSNAYRFDGDDDRIDAPDESLPIGNNPRTIAFWVYYEGNQEGGNDHLVNYGQANDTKAFGVIIGRNDKLAGYTHVRDTFFKTVLPKRIWKHLTMTYQAGKVSLYIDGLVSDKGLMNPNTVLSNLRIGNPPTGTWRGHYFKGKLDDIRIYNRALSDKEVRAIYNSEKPRG